MTYSLFLALSACGRTSSNPSNILMTNDRTEVKKYTLSNPQDVDTLWDALRLPEKTIDRTYLSKEFQTTGSEFSIFCKHTVIPPFVEPNRGSCEVSVKKDINGLYFPVESDSKTFYELLQFKDDNSRSAELKYFQSSDKKFQIYCMKNTIPINPYKFACWVKVEDVQ